MSRHEPAPTRHYISSVLFVGACGRSSQERGHALTSLRYSVTCEECKRLVPERSDYRKAGGNYRTETEASR